MLVPAHCETHYLNSASSAVDECREAPLRSIRVTLADIRHARGASISVRGVYQGPVDIPVGTLSHINHWRAWSSLSTYGTTRFFLHLFHMVAMRLRIET